MADFAAGDSIAWRGWDFLNFLKPIKPTEPDPRKSAIAGKGANPR
jgi:hypothetical protein